MGLKFSGGLFLLARTFFAVDENRALPFLILRKTISLTSLNHANKMTRQRQLSLRYSDLFVNDQSSCISYILLIVEDIALHHYPTFCTFIVFDA